MKPANTAGPVCADPVRERARKWRALGEAVRQAMDIRASLMRPQPGDFKTVAGKLTVTTADASRAWRFLAGDIECPKRCAPAFKAPQVNVQPGHDASRAIETKGCST